MNRTWIPRLFFVATLALLATACGPAPSESAPTQAGSTVTPGQLSADTPAGYRAVEIPEAGIGFDVPGTWQQAGQEWAWSPQDADGERVGLSWIDLQPPMEAEAALLPRPSQILGSQPVELAWASGRSFTVAVYGPVAAGREAQAPVQSVQTHVLVVASGEGSRRAYDFYAAGPTVEALDTLQIVLDRMLTTAVPVDGLSKNEAVPAP
jgi:hypothetical protein